MTAPFVPQDQPVRDRIASDLDATLFVEAGAGTGKTTALVARIVALVASGRAGIDQLAAITFTEAAAAELREKVRRALKMSTQNLSLDPRGQERCREALAQLDGAAIQTLHSFAGALLRERPLEAGLPPTFEVVDEIAAGLAFEDRWQTWLDQALASSALAPHLLRALLLDLRLDDLHTVAKAFHQNYDLLNHPFLGTGAPPQETARMVVEAVLEIQRWLPLARLGNADPLASHARRVMALGERLGKIGPETDAAFAMLARWGKLSFSRGRQQDWDTDPEAKVNGAKGLKDLLQELESARATEVAAVRQAALLPLLEGLRSLVLAYADERRRTGRVEFHDLLVWARDLLRDNEGARAFFRERFRALLIDEFQDTDPIQAEIAFLLAGRLPANAMSDGVGQWTDVRLEPGKLFVVGDPKQSIYRFRRADISALEQVQGLLGTDSVVHLVQNFRSPESVLAWVNAVFGRWMGEGSPGLQAPYVELAARWAAPDALPPLGVHRVGAPQDGRADQVRREESAALARLVRETTAVPWMVRDEEGEGLRPACFQDICILLPARTGLRALEQAMEDAGAPYRIESQSLVLQTQDVRELLNCLRAIDSPADQVALVAALRSSAFGCSDVELLEFVEAGGHFDLTQPGMETGPVREALEALRGYHEARLWEPVDQLIERVVRERRMVETGFGRTRPRERWRRLHFVIERARAFGRSGGMSLRAFLDWMERQVDEGARMVEAPVAEMDDDTVRVMTMHAAKGLEFPIVVVAGLGAAANTRRSPVIFDRATGAVEVCIGRSDGSAFATDGYETAQAREKAAQEAEDVRLLYVAATRARDHLVVSLFHPAKSKAARAAAILRWCRETGAPWREIPAAEISEPQDASTVGRPVGIASETATDREAWLVQRAAVLQWAAAPNSLAVTRLARIEKEEAERGEAPYRWGRGGTRLGRAVHAVLQSVDLAAGEGLEEISKAQAAAEGIADRWREVARLARRGQTSAVVRRAVASGRYYREVFVGAPVGESLVEGFVDLLFEDAGGLVIVDYKTDVLDGEDELAGAQERYALQVGSYALTVQAATGQPVREVVLLFLDADREVQFSDISALIAQARERVKAVQAGPGWAVSGGPASAPPPEAE